MFEDVDLLSGTRGGGEIRTWLSALDGVECYRCRLILEDLLGPLLGGEALDRLVRESRAGAAAAQVGLRR